MAFLAALLGAGGGAAAGGAGAGAAGGASAAVPAAAGTAAGLGAAGTGAAAPAFAGPVSGGKGSLGVLGRGLPAAGSSAAGGLPPVAGSAASMGIPSAGGTGAGTGAGIGPLLPTSQQASVGELTNMGDIMPARSSAGLGINMGGPAAPLGGGVPFTPTGGGVPNPTIPGLTLGAGGLGQGGGQGMPGRMTIGQIARRYWMNRLGIQDPQDSQMMDMMRGVIQALATQQVNSQRNQ